MSLEIPNKFFLLNYSSSTVYGNGYLNETQHENDLIEEDWTMDQSTSFSQGSTRYESQEYVEDDMTDDGI